MSKKPYPSRQLAKINVRLPHAMRRKLQATAKREGRSMNAQAVQILKDGLERLNSQAA